MTEKGEFMHRNLRDKLDCLGYNQPFPVAAVPLVGSIFDDLIKTTESLRDSKLKISQLLEEKSCWELGVEPYKCDNSRLLSDCNQLHLELLNQRENYEKEISEIARRIRTLETEKHHLQDHCNNLEKALKTQASSAKNPPKRMAGGSNAKKPFTSAVKSGSSFPPLDTQLSINKCDCYVVCKDKPEGKSLAKHSKEIEKLQKDLKDLCDDLNLHKRRVESRDREISRLNDLMKGGRPPAALARDCCYKNYGALSEDVELLQQEKYENHSKIKSYEQKMHEAMQRAVHLAEQNKRLTEDLDELKEVALKVEKDANTELSQRDKQIEKLKADVEMLKSYLDKENKTPKTHDEKRKLNEKINELTQKESTLKLENDRMHKKIHKLKHKIHKEKSQEKEQGSIEEIMRLKTERDFFHQEYLRFMSKPPTDKAVEVLQLDIRLKEEEIQELKSRLQGSSRYENSSNDYENLKMELRMKDEEIRSLRIELQNNQIQTSRSQRSGTTNGECVQAVVLRLEREMNCLRADIENSDVEKRKLLAKLHYLNQSHLEEVQRYKEKVEDLQSQCNRLEKDCTEKSCNRIPGQTQIVLLKEENEELKNSSRNIEKENYQLKSSNEHLKLLLDQTEKALIDYQNRFALAETQLGTVESKLTTLDSNRDRSKADIAKLKTENTKLRAIVFELENEKDGFVCDLDTKTEKIAELEYELKHVKNDRNQLDREISEYKSKYERQTAQSKKNECKLHETSTESKTLRQQLDVLKDSRDAAICENNRLSTDLADCKSDGINLKRKLKDSEKEVERLKQQLKQYVQEVKKAEDLLMEKETEREEMLDHYRCLSHDAIILEGNNQSLENETTEQRRLLSEAEEKIIQLEDEIKSKDTLIEKLEDQVANLLSQNSSLEKELQEAYDDQKLLKVDLEARRELCDKLDIQKDKLNAELMELGGIHRKLERDNELLRKEFEKNTTENQASTESFETLLNQTRQDLDEQILQQSKLSQELLRMRKDNADLKQQYQEESVKRKQSESLAKEYEVQNQELRHNMTDQRFREAQNREQNNESPGARYLADTM